ncbi:hypothetical protein PPYR_08720 [Photinus pyralis]|uniref:Uncharacterized protein n=1 Tax=Photinus pyralis TaxID=7054 RepID=A0A5N4AK79_PHOPY|nr:neprilysin-2-like [Photinus pyralis]KAB0797727.1 hypothetical protein PPYR_08720 [Photinus pyralis]
MEQVVFLFVTCAFVLLSAAAAPTTEVTTCTAETTDTSDESKQASAAILKFIDQSVNPCDDFYQFACGGYIKSKEIPPDDVEVSQFRDINNVVTEQLHQLLKEPIDSDAPRWSKIPKQFFQACVNSEKKNHGIKTMKALLKEVGGWPAVEGDHWSGDDFNWEEMIYKFRKHGFLTSQFLATIVDIHLRNSSMRVIAIKQPRTLINRVNLEKGFDDKIVQSYYKFLVDLAVAFGANKDMALAEMKAFVDFMREISQIKLPPEKLRNLTALSNVMTVEELQKQFPYLNWVEYLTKVVGPNVEITAKDFVDVNMPTYVTNLGILLNKTEKRVLANYVVTLAVESGLQFLSSEIRDLQLELKKARTGVSSVMAKWKECIGAVSSHLNIGTAALYARKHFTKEAKANIAKLITDLHEEFIDILKVVDWMDEDTRNEALTKAKPIRKHVAYPQELLDDDILNEYYKSLEYSDDYLHLGLNVNKFSWDKQSETLFEPVVASDWKQQSISHQVNAFYDSSDNSIIIPAGILQGALFGHGRPDYMNYAGIGFIAGHELTHGFDDRGKQLNKMGELETWWSPETEIAYTEKAKCIRDQYSSFKSEKLDAHVNGIVTLGENIADNGGLKIAYRAYEKHRGSEKCLPNLAYTPKQLFWISMANVWCTKQREEQTKMELLTSGHTPSIFRVNGVVTNSKDFARDFNCPANSRMNPEKKCTFW